MNYLGNKISQLRKDNNLTQQELALQINYSDKVISKWERGECLPDIIALQTLSEFFKVDINTFLNNNEEKKVNNVMITQKADWSRFKIPCILLQIIILAIPLILSCFAICIVADINGYNVNGYLVSYDTSSIVAVVFAALLFILTLVDIILSMCNKHKVRLIFDFIIFGLIALLIIFVVILSFIYGLAVVNEISTIVFYIVISCILNIIVNYIFIYKNVFKK